MNHTLSLGLTSAVCALLAGTAGPVGAAEDQAVTLCWSPKAGDSVRYRTTIKLDIGGNDIVVEQNRRHVVRRIKDSRDVVIVVEEEGGKVIAGGAENAIPAGAPTTITLDKSNKVLEFQVERDDNPYLSAAAQHLIALIDRIVLPEKPVKPGDSWTTEVDNPRVKGRKVTIKSVYVGEDKADGVPVWKIKQTVEADTDESGGKLKAESTARLEAATGQLLDAEQTVRGLPGNMGPVDWNGTIKRMKAESGGA